VLKALHSDQDQHEMIHQPKIPTDILSNDERDGHYAHDQTCNLFSANFLMKLVALIAQLGSSTMHTRQYPSVHSQLNI
jgi:hypothetical protein